MEQDTIFALSSGKGKAGVAVIRVSGENALEALSHCGIDEEIKPRTACLKKLTDYRNNAVIDHALVIYFKAPYSFTGEDSVEFHLHGSVAVINNMLDMLASIEGFRPAEAGEFSRRSFDNDKMDLLQAEGLSDLIEAETSAQAKQSLRFIEGETSNLYEYWREAVIEIRALIEAYVDFPDEDIPPQVDNQAFENSQILIEQIDKQLSNKSGERLRKGIVAAIIGPPNAGKSTLINKLSRREVAIVSDIAGTTRDSLECHLDINGYPLTLIDTAGIRRTEDVIESEGVKRAKEKANNADFMIVIFSAENYPNFGSEALNMIDKNSIVIINKADLKKIEISDLKINSENIIITSLLNPQAAEPSYKGIEDIEEVIAAKLENMMESSESAIITRQRHKTALQSCRNCLEEFIKARKEHKQTELCAENLRQASFYLSSITGRIDVENVLDKIFSEFCIGK